MALVPLAGVDAGVEQRVVDESVLRGDRVEVPADLVAERVAGRGHVVHLFEHRHVDVRLDVAHHAGVPVPVPGASDPAGLVDQHDPPEPGVAQLRAHDHAGHPGADDGDVDVLDDRFALDEGRERIARVLGEPCVALQVVDDPATLGHALGALRWYLVADRLGIEGGGCRVGGIHAASAVAFGGRIGPTNSEFERLIMPHCAGLDVVDARRCRSTELVTRSA